MSEEKKETEKTETEKKEPDNNKTDIKINEKKDKKKNKRKNKEKKISTWFIGVFSLFFLIISVVNMLIFIEVL